MTVLKYRLYIDPVNSAHLKQVEQIDCGWVAPLPKKSHYDAATGLHYTLGPVSALPGAQYWMNQDGTTAKAVSLAVPPMSWNNSVQRLTQHFEHMSMRNAGHVADFGSLLGRSEQQKLVRFNSSMTKLAWSTTRAMCSPLLNWFLLWTDIMAPRCTYL